MIHGRAIKPSTQNESENEDVLECSPLLYLQILYPCICTCSAMPPLSRVV